MKLCFKFYAGLVFLFLLGIQDASAAGFYIKELGTPASLGMAGVGGVTNNITADSAWSNPAGMTGMTEDSIVVGATILGGKIEFDSDVAEAGGSDGGNALETVAIPSFFYTRVMSEQSRFGFSVVASVGGGVDYGDDFVGRYSIQNVELAGLAFTPSYAYQVNDRLSLGFGLSVIQTVLEQDIAINTLPAREDGQASFKDLEDWGYQGIFGLTYQSSKNMLVGVVYRTESSLDLEGDLEVEGLAFPVPKQDVNIEWDNPQTLELGIQHTLNDKQLLFVNLGWQDWSAFSENKLSVSKAGISEVTDRNWDDTWHLGIGFVQRYTEGHFYSLGLSYESSPVDDKDRTYDFPVDEMWKVAGGYGWEGGGNSDFAIGATLTFVGDSPIDQTSQGVNSSGEFDKYMTLAVGGAWRYKF